MLPISRGTANAILEAADKLRSREAIAGVADIEAVLGGLEKGDAPTHDKLAGLVSIHAARRANGLATGGQWLSDGGVALCKALVEKWPLVPTGVIEAQVYGVSLNPALVGVSTHNWSPESGDEAARVLLAEFGRVVSTIRSRSDFSPLDDLVEWTETHHRSPPFWLRECLDGFEPDRSLREDFNRAVCEKIATGMADLGRVWGVGDVVAAFKIVLAKAIAEVRGVACVEVPAMNVVVGFARLDRPYSLRKAS